MQVLCEISNRIGCFRVLFGADPQLMHALSKIITPLRKEPDETGRGIMYYAASDLFEPLNEGDGIPEYRIEAVYDGHFAQADHEARRIEAGQWAFVAIRKIVIQVPPATWAHISPAPLTRH